MNKRSTKLPSDFWLLETNSVTLPSIKWLYLSDTPSCLPDLCLGIKPMHGYCSHRSRPQRSYYRHSHKSVAGVSAGYGFKSKNGSCDGAVKPQLSVIKTKWIFDCTIMAAILIFFLLQPECNQT